MQEWLPLIITGIFAAFGVAIWAFVSNLLKKFDQILNKNAKKVDLFTEQYMGDTASDEMWKQLRYIGESLVRTANEMIALDSFRKQADSESGKPDGAVTDVSDQLSGSNK